MIPLPAKKFEKQTRHLYLKQHLGESLGILRFLLNGRKKLRVTYTSGGKSRLTLVHTVTQAGAQVMGS